MAASKQKSCGRFIRFCHQKAFATHQLYVPLNPRMRWYYCPYRTPPTRLLLAARNTGDRCTRLLSRCMFREARRLVLLLLIVRSGHECTFLLGLWTVATSHDEAPVAHARFWNQLALYDRHHTRQSRKKKYIIYSCDTVARHITVQTTRSIRLLGMLPAGMEIAGRDERFF